MANFYGFMPVGTIGIQWSRWYLAHPESVTVAAVIPMFLGISAYTAMISGVKISQLGLKRTVDDNPVKLNFLLQLHRLLVVIHRSFQYPGLWLYRKRPAYIIAA